METKDKIVEVAIELFMLYGIRSVTMDDIARQAGISKKTIYLDFANKEHLVSEIFDKMMKQDECRFAEMMQKEEGVIDHLLEMTKYVRQRFAHMNPVVFYDLQKYYPQCWKKLEVFKEKHAVKGLIKVLEKGKKAGYFRPEINSEILAMMRMDQVTSSFLSVKFPMDRFNLLEFQLHVFDHFIHGILTEKGKETYYQKIEKQEN